MDTKADILDKCISLSPQAAEVIVLYTDGACSGNPGIGGWAYNSHGYISGKTEQNFGSEDHTTNNRMELTAICEGLTSTYKASADPRKANIFVVSDSQYCMNGLNAWAKKWKENHWRTTSNKPVANQDLWEKILELTSRFLHVYCIWVKGHGTVEGNVEADKWATFAIEKAKERKELEDAAAECS